MSHANLDKFLSEKGITGVNSAGSTTITTPTLSSQRLHEIIAAAESVGHTVAMSAGSLVISRP